MAKRLMFRHSTRRDGERQRETETERDREKTETDRDRDRETERETERLPLMKYCSQGWGGGIFSDAKSPVFRGGKYYFRVQIDAGGDGGGGGVSSSAN